MPASMAAALTLLASSAGSVSAAVSVDSVEEEVFENERFARGGALSGQVGAS